MTYKYPIILASQSPRRRELLAMICGDFTVRAADIDETPDPRLAPAQWAEDIAARKSLAAQQLYSEAIIIAADTMVLLDGVSYAKPADATEASEMLRALSGKCHQVITGVSIRLGMDHQQFSCETNVTMMNLSKADLEYYISTYRPYDKAGGYGIQDWIGHARVTRIEGSYTNIVGLPLAQLAEHLAVHRITV